MKNNSKQEKSCKNCICVAACDAFFPNAEGVPERLPCEHFKDSSKFMELPTNLKKGDRVYFIDEEKGKYEVVESPSIVSAVMKEGFFTYGYTNCTEKDEFDAYRDDFNSYSEIGDTCFYTIEEAQEAADKKNAKIKTPEKQKADTVHLLLNNEAIRYLWDDLYRRRLSATDILFQKPFDTTNETLFFTYEDTMREICDGLRDIYTTVPHFLNFKYAKRLFVHVDNDIHEITIGKCDGTTREISESTNIEKLLNAGEFDWWAKKKKGEE